MRVVPVALVGLLLAAAAVLTLASREERRASGRRSIEQMADEAGAQVMRLLYRGHVAGLSGEIHLVPKPNNYMSSPYDLTALGTDDPETFVSHPNPWSHLSRVPLIVYRPGSIPAGGRNTEPVDVTQIAPTYARLLGIDGLVNGSPPLPGIDSSGSAPPLIVTVVIDGGGWNVLQQHPNSWPALRELQDEGLTFGNATIGSAPALTGPIHANIGTGSYPRTHGIPNNPLWSPDALHAPTVSDLWDERRHNLPVIGAIAYHGFHLGMLGQGAARDGADADLAVLWSHKRNGWHTADGYTLPEALASTDLARLESYERGLDGRDGITDGTWFGHSLEELRHDVLRPATPAFVRFHGDATIDLVRNEGFGDDALTDLLWVEFKMPDYAGHQWNVVAPEIGDVIAETDAQIGRLKRELDSRVGEGSYLLTVTADHGQEPLAETTGGWRINAEELERDLRAEFGDSIAGVSMQDVQLANDSSLDEGEVARFIGAYTVADNIPEGLPGAGRVPDAALDEEVFAAAFPSDFLASLDETTLDEFGDSAYEQGSLWTGRDGR